MLAGPSHVISAPRLLKGAYFEGQRDLVSKLVGGISRVTVWVIGVINLLITSP